MVTGPVYLYVKVGSGFTLTTQIVPKIRSTALSGHMLIIIQKNASINVLRPVKSEKIQLGCAKRAATQALPIGILACA